MDLDFRNKWVLVTGASSGLGEVISRQLTLDHGANLIIVARREEKLIALKTAIESLCSSKVEYFTADLSSEAEITDLYHKIRHLPVYAAVINAGMTLFEAFMQSHKDSVDQMIRLNIQSTVSLTRYMIENFREHKSDGGILYISSLGAFYPTPYQAIYSGTKAFINNFILAISQEHRKEPFSFSIYTPGGIKTEMTANDRVKHLERFLDTPESCAKTALRGFRIRQLVFSSFTSIEIVLSRLIPTKLKLMIMRKVYE